MACARRHVSRIVPTGCNDDVSSGQPGRATWPDRPDPRDLPDLARPARPARPADLPDPPDPTDAVTVATRDPPPLDAAVVHAGRRADHRQRRLRHHRDLPVPRLPRRRTTAAALDRVPAAAAGAGLRRARRLRRAPEQRRGSRCSAPTSTRWPTSSRSASRRRCSASRSGCAAAGTCCSSPTSSSAASAGWRGSTSPPRTLADEATGKVKYFEGTPIPTSIVIVALLGVALLPRADRRAALVRRVPHRAGDAASARARVRAPAAAR